MLTILHSLGIWCKLERWKGLVKWLPQELTENFFKNRPFKVLSSLILCNNDKPFLDQTVTWWKVDFKQQPSTTSSVARRRSSSKGTSQILTCTEKTVSITVWWSTASLIHYTFLNSWKIITSEKYAQQINEMHWKLQRLQPTLVNRMSPILLHNDVWLHDAQPMLQKLNKLGYEVLPHLPYSPDLSPNNCQLQASQQLFVGNMLAKTAGGGKCFITVCRIPRYSFYATRTNLVLIGKNVFGVMVTILINKDVFELSYND